MQDDRQAAPADEGRAVLWSESVAVFYPPGFDPAATLPSLALVREPEEAGPLPPDWGVRPRFGSAMGRASAEIATGPDTDLYGTGEVTGPLRRNGTVVQLWNTDNPSYRRVQGQRLYQSHPWVLAVRPDGTAFGVLHDSTWRQEIACGRSIRFETDGPQGRVIVITGNDPLDVVRQLSDLTGRIAMPPLWALGYHQCRWSYYPDARVREVADTFRARDIPLDVLWLDIHYMDEYRVFTFDAQRFPDPGETIGYLAQRDVRTVWMIDPGVKWEEGYQVFDSGSEQNIWVRTKDGSVYRGEVWPGDVAFPDFTMERAGQWWKEQYRGFLAYGMDGIWNDMNEPAVFSSPDWTMPDDNHHRGGARTGEDGRTLPPGPHIRYHNAYGMLMAAATRDAVLEERPGRRPFVLTRASFLGGQRHAATWTGDNRSSWEHLRMSIPMSLNLSLSGQPFSGPDIGGFEGEAWPELFAHWMAVGAFFPFCRGHTIEGSADHEPWSFGPETEEVARIALRQRYALLPYLYTLFHRAASGGDPVMQPVFLAAPGEASPRSLDDRFLLGLDLLIEPRWAEPGIEVPGAWEAVRVVPEEPCDDRYHPRVLLRRGAIVPSCPPASSTAALDLERIILNAHADAAGGACGQWYWDEGDGWAFEAGDYSLLTFRLRCDAEGPALELCREGHREVPAKEIVLRLWSGGRFTEHRWPFAAIPTAG